MTRKYELRLSVRPDPHVPSWDERVIIEAAYTAEDAITQVKLRLGKDDRIQSCGPAQETPPEYGECPECRAGTGHGGKRIHLSLCPSANRGGSL